MITKELPHKPWVIQVIHEVESNKYDTYEVDCLLQPNPHDYARNKVLNYLKINDLPLLAWLL